MRARFFSLVLGGFLLVGLLAALPFPLAEAAIAPCNPGDPTFTDESGDAVESPMPNPVPEEQSQFGRVDIRTVCFTETVDAVHVVVSVATAVESDAQQRYHYQFHFTAEGTNEVYTYQHTGGNEVASPGGGAESSGTVVQFNVLKTEFPVGTTLDRLFVNASARYIVPATLAVVTAEDRAPQAGNFNLIYDVGARAPPGVDTDGDGADDRTEVAVGSDPQDADSDDDGLSDGEELDAGSNPTLADTDDDGLGDEAEVRGEYTNASGTFQTAPTDPARRDSDGDGLTDLEEIQGEGNTYRTGVNDFFFEGLPGSTDPNNADTDGDGLTDQDEITGNTTIAGQAKSFPPTNPNAEDTDGDNLKDREEIEGLVIAGAERITFSPTDPTLWDTDGDKSNDFEEVDFGSDPTDPDDAPKTAPLGDVLTYLPLSGAALLIIILIGAGGIRWRWG